MKRGPAAGPEPAHQATQQRSDSDQADAEALRAQMIWLYFVKPCVSEHRQSHSQKACQAAERIGQRAAYLRINKEAGVGYGQQRQGQEERQGGLSFEKRL